MVNLGYFLASELHDPDDMVEWARLAENGGFDFVVVSDHYHPWTTTQGNSPFVWNVLGGIASVTDRIGVGTAVTCPTIRIHPAIMAQAAATSQVMLDGRFFFGVGTGERLNETIHGDRWPPHSVRLSMLEEAIEIIRELWGGKMVTRHGDHYTVENAQLFTLPEAPPPIVVSGLGSKTAGAAGRIADGFLSTAPKNSLIEAYDDALEDGTAADYPTYGGTRVCYADSVQAGVETAYELWPNTALVGVGQELSIPQQFEEAIAMIDEEDVAESMVTGPDPKAFREDIEAYVDAGYDHVYIHQVGYEQEAFIEFAEREILPAFD